MIALAAVSRALALAFAQTKANEAPEPKSPIAMLLVEFIGPSKHLGQPLICPGDTEPTKSEELCISEMYEAPFTVLRRIGGDRKVAGPTLRYKIAEFGIPAGSRVLIAAMPMAGSKGLFAPWWRERDDRGEICLDQAEAATLDIVAQWSRWHAHTVRWSNNSAKVVRCLRP